VTTFICNLQFYCISSKFCFCGNCLVALSLTLVKHNTLKLGLEPLDSILLRYPVRNTHARLTGTALGNTISRAVQHNIEIHTINTSRWIVFNTEINVFGNTKTEITSSREISADKFVFLNLEASLEELHGLFAANGNKARNLFVTTDRPLAHSVAGLSENRRLTSQLF